MLNLKEIQKLKPVGNLSNDHIEGSIKFLNKLLANEFALFTKTLNYHWNVTGPRFNSIHSFLEKHYQQIIPIMDDAAERVRILGGTPKSTVGEMKETMTIDEVNGGTLGTDEMLGDLFLSNVQIQDSINAFIKENNEEVDLGTEDFLVSILKKHEFMSWNLKSHLH